MTRKTNASLPAGWTETIRAMVQGNCTRSINIGLWGPAGTGKSYALPALFADYETVTLHGHTQPHELLGVREVDGDGLGGTRTYFSEGPAVRAMVRGIPLILDEFDAAGPELRCLLHQICDPDRSKIKISLSDGRIITPSDGFFVVATMNANPSRLPDPIRNRFVWILAATPAQGLIDALPPGIGRYLANAYDSRARNINAWTETEISARGVQYYLALRDALGEDRAARILWGDDLGAEILAASAAVEIGD
jgi:hypothetical protein